MVASTTLWQVCIQYTLAVIALYKSSTFYETKLYISRQQGTIFPDTASAVWLHAWTGITFHNNIFIQAFMYFSETMSAYTLLDFIMQANFSQINKYKKQKNFLNIDINQPMLAKLFICVCVCMYVLVSAYKFPLKIWGNLGCRVLQCKINIRISKSKRYRPWTYLTQCSLYPSNCHQSHSIIFIRPPSN